MYSILFSTLLLASLRSWLTSAGPISLKTLVLSSARSSSSFTCKRGRYKKRKRIDRPSEAKSWSKTGSIFEYKFLVRDTSFRYLHLSPLTCLFSLSWLSRVCLSASILLYSLWTDCRLLAESWNCFCSISTTFMMVAKLCKRSSINKNKNTQTAIVKHC